MCTHTRFGINFTLPLYTREISYFFVAIRSGTVEPVNWSVYWRTHFWYAVKSQRQIDYFFNHYIVDKYRGTTVLFARISVFLSLLTIRSHCSIIAALFPPPPLLPVINNFFLVLLFPFTINRSICAICLPPSLSSFSFRFLFFPLLPTTTYKFYLFIPPRDFPKKKFSSSRRN